MCSHLFIFPQRLPTDSFFPHLPHLFIFSLLFNFSHFFFLFFFSIKASTLSPSFTIWFFLLAFSLKLSASLHFLISSMAPKSKKTSHMLSSNAFNFTCWSGSETNGTPSVDIPAGESIIFRQMPEPNWWVFQFFSFLSFPLIFCFNLFLDL